MKRTIISENDLIKKYQLITDHRESPDNRIGVVDEEDTTVIVEGGHIEDKEYLLEKYSIPKNREIIEIK